MSTAIASGGGARRPLRIGRVLVVAAALAATTVPVARFLTAGRDAGDQTAPPRIESDQERLTSLQQRVASSPDDAGAWLSLAELATQQAVRTGDPASYDVAQRAVGRSPPAHRRRPARPRRRRRAGPLAPRLRSGLRASARRPPGQPGEQRLARRARRRQRRARPLRRGRPSRAGDARPPARLRRPGPGLVPSRAQRRPPGRHRRHAAGRQRRHRQPRRHRLVHRAPRSPLPGAGRPRPCRHRLRRCPRAGAAAGRSDARVPPASRPRGATSGGHRRRHRRHHPDLAARGGHAARRAPPAGRRPRRGRRRLCPRAGQRAAPRRRRPRHRPRERALRSRPWRPGTRRRAGRGRLRRAPHRLHRRRARLGPHPVGSGGRSRTLRRGVAATRHLVGRAPRARRGGLRRGRPARGGHGPAARRLRAVPVARTAPADDGRRPRGRPRAARPEPGPPSRGPASARPAVGPVSGRS